MARNNPRHFCVGLGYRDGMKPLWRTGPKKNRKLDGALRMIERLTHALAEERAARQELEARLAAAERRLAGVPGVAGAKGGARVTIGGVEVELRPLSPRDWLRATETLPAFLLAHAVAKQEGREMSAEDLEAFVDEVRTWLEASLSPEDRERVDLSRLTVPEAMNGAGVTARLNGLDEQLAAYFRRGVARKGARPGGEAVQREAIGAHRPD